MRNGYRRWCLTWDLRAERKIAEALRGAPRKKALVKSHWRLWMRMADLEGSFNYNAAYAPISELSRNRFRNCSFAQSSRTISSNYRLEEHGLDFHAGRVNHQPQVVRSSVRGLAYKWGNLLPSHAVEGVPRSGGGRPAEGEGADQASLVSHYH